MNTSAPTATTVESPALEFAFRLVNGYVRSGLEGRFRKSLRFTEDGVARAAAILGYIVGLAEGGQAELATHLADAILAEWDRLDAWGNDIPPFCSLAMRQVRGTMVELSEDGTRHGFRVTWRVAVTDEQATRVIAARGEHAVKHYGNGWERTAYTLSMHGGLLYHGPGGGEVFAVTIGSPSLWSIHT